MYINLLIWKTWDFRKISLDSIQTAIIVSSTFTRRPSLLVQVNISRSQATHSSRNSGETVGGSNRLLRSSLKWFIFYIVETIAISCRPPNMRLELELQHPLMYHLLKRTMSLHFNLRSQRSRCQSLLWRYKVLHLLDSMLRSVTKSSQDYLNFAVRDFKS